MFNNLIESSSHAKEFKRRGSFLLFTTASYVLLFAIAGVASVFAYDAHLGKQNTELELIGMVPVEPPQATPPEVVRNTIRPTSPTDRTPTRSTRTELISSTSDPSRVPDQPGTQAVTILPARPDSVVSSINADPPTPFSSGPGVPGGTGTAVVEMPDPPPAAPPQPTPVKILRISRVLNSQATYLPKPVYPPIAKQIRQQGTVTVLVLIDESGNVVSAKATSGPPLLAREAEKAALHARFSPTVLSDRPIKVSGVITYNFVLN
ncbi:MAG TPA: TonB family protein [Pyrinomonadaceae bacterium]